MGFLATVAEFLRSSDQGTPTPEVKCDPGDGDAATHFHFTPPGTDAAPLPGDVAYLGDDLGRGTAQAVGYQDPKNAGVALGGEHRLYARAPGGTVVAEAWLKGDGSILIRSVLAGSTVELAADGAILLAGPLASAELGADGAIELTGPVASASLGPDGTIELGNGAASAELGADGAIELSNALGGLEIAASGNVVATTPLGTFGAGTHGHNSPFGPIGPPIPGT